MYEAQALTRWPAQVMNGLSSTESYVILHRQKRNAMHLAIRPMVFRLGTQTIFVGGKLRIGGDGTYGGQVPDKIAATDVDERLEQLKAGYTGFSWSREDSRRVSTTVGLGFAATESDGEAFRDYFTEVDFIDKLVNVIENRTGTTVQNKRKVKQLLSDAYARLGGRCSIPTRRFPACPRSCSV